MKFPQLVIETKEILSEIEEAYNFGTEYFDGKIWDIDFKVRMNKNHARNQRNDDKTINNISLVNCFCNEADTRQYVNVNGVVQAQYHEVYDFEKVAEYLLDFFYEIAEQNNI
jgi:hypothetical protein